MIVTRIQLYIAAAVAALLLVLLGVQHVRLAGAQRDEAKARAEAAQVRADYERTKAALNDQRLAASERNRALEAQLREKEDAAAKELQVERGRNAAAAAGHQSDVGELRGALSRAWAAADAASAAGDASAAEWRERAAAAGALLDDGLRVQGALAEGAEAHAAEVRRLLARERATTCGGGR